MDSTVELLVTLSRPAAAADEEPEEPLHARVRVIPRAEAAVRPQLDLCFVLDASASMHRFVLDPAQRSYWQQRAEQRGEVSRQQADGRVSMVWSGQTLRELQQVVSTPMISTLRGVWRTLEALEPADRVSVVAFADKSAVIHEDGGTERTARLQTARPALGRLGSGVDQSGLGRGTRLAAALQHTIDRLAADDGSSALRRVVLVSDGVVEDAEACRALLDVALDRGLVISVIGVGEDFDEEFLMRTADLTRGDYYYAATALDVEQAVERELAVMTSMVGRRAVLRVRPENGTVLHDVFPVAPEMSEFQTMWVENGGWRFRIGDLSAGRPLEFILELAPPAQPAGEARLAAVRVEALGPLSAEPFSVDAAVQVLYSPETMLLQAVDEEAAAAVRRLEIYREERRAAIAAAHGDQETATKHLRAATRMLRSIGANDLAEEMDAAASETETGTKNLTRTKRVKAGTRRLGQKSPDEPAPAAPIFDPSSVI